MDLFQPAWMSKNEKRALKAVVCAIENDDQTLLNRIVNEAPSIDARVAAASHISDQETLAELALHADHWNVQLAAVKNTTSQSVLEAVFNNTQNHYDVRNAAIIRLTDTSALVLIAKNSFIDNFRKLAFKKLSAQSDFVEIAENGKYPDTRQWAIEQLTEQSVLLRAAMTDTSPSVRLAAFQRISDSSAYPAIFEKETCGNNRREIAARFSNRQRRVFCGKYEETPHQWSGCTCKCCGERRNRDHRFVPVPDACLERCSQCGVTRQGNHDFVYDSAACIDRCSRCGASQTHHDFAKNDVCRVCQERHYQYSMGHNALREYGKRFIMIETRVFAVLDDRGFVHYAVKETSDHKVDRQAAFYLSGKFVALSHCGAGVRANGCVVEHRQESGISWRNMVSLDRTYSDSYFGIMKSGRVCYYRSPKFRLKGISHPEAFWEDVVDVVYGTEYLVGLHGDGKVSVAFEQSKEEELSENKLAFQAWVAELQDVCQVAAGQIGFYALKRNGTLVCFERKTSWHYAEIRKPFELSGVDCVMLTVSSVGLLGLGRDGSVKWLSGGWSTILSSGGHADRVEKCPRKLYSGNDLVAIDNDYGLTREGDVYCLIFPDLAPYRLQ